MRFAGRLIQFVWEALSGGHEGALGWLARSLNLVCCVATLFGVFVWVLSYRVGVVYEQEGTYSRYFLSSGWLLRDFEQDDPRRKPASTTMVRTYSPWTFAHGPLTQLHFTEPVMQWTGYSLPWLTASAASFPAFTLLWFLWRRRRDS